MAEAGRDDGRSGRNQGMGQAGRLRFAAGVALSAYLLALMVGAAIEPPALARQSGSLLVHAAAFVGAQCLVFLLAPTWRGRLLWFGLLFAFGLVIEAVQFFLPWRSATWIDLVYNASGLSISFLLCALLEVVARRLGLPSAAEVTRRS